MKKARWFTDEELREMEPLTRELIKAAIDADDKVKAKTLTDRMYDEFFEMHSMYAYWVTSLLTFIGRRYGDKTLEEALIEVWKAPVASHREDPMWQEFLKGNGRKGAERVIGGLRGHLQPLKIEEDDEKVVIQMQPCGSGGLLILNKCYEPPVNFMKIEKPQPMTYGKANMPVYCAHAAIMAMMAIESGGLLYLEEPSDNLGEKPCRMIVYKDPEAWPADVYEKLGKKKQKGSGQKARR